jgi:hypothetical protein
VPDGVFPGLRRAVAAAPESFESTGHDDLDAAAVFVVVCRVGLEFLSPFGRVFMRVSINKIAQMERAGWGERGLQSNCTAPSQNMWSSIQDAVLK